jgi:Caspase domain
MRDKYQKFKAGAVGPGAKNIQILRHPDQPEEPAVESDEHSTSHKAPKGNAARSQNRLPWIAGAVLGVILVGAIVLSTIEFFGLLRSDPPRVASADNIRGSRQLGVPSSSALKPFSGHHALVIGINQYKSDKWINLSNAEKDAVEVARELKKRKFNVTTVLGSKATIAGLMKAFNDFIDSAGQDPDARLFIWFAGHGHTIGDREYILPMDALAPDEKLFSSRAIRLSVLRTMFEDIKSRHLLAVFDSCFSGSIHEATKRGKPVPPAIEAAINNRAHQLLSSGKKGQQVSDDGTFRKLFLAAIRGNGPATGIARDGYLTTEELFSFLRRSVAAHKRGQQTPVFTNLPIRDFSGGSFVFRTGTANQQPSN